MIKFFMVERLDTASLQYLLISEEELLGCLERGEKPHNAYIYAVADDQADLDGEIFSTERLRKVSDLMSPALQFEHSQAIVH